MSDPVAVKRLSDGKWLRRSDGHGRINLFSDELPPGKLKNRLKAVMMIRVDFGDDLAGYEIIPWHELDEGLKTP